MVYNLVCGDTLIITVTKQNFIRYSGIASCPGISGIDKIHSLDEVHIFPNPVEEYLYIELSNQQEFEVSIYSADGAIVRKSKNITYTNQPINIASLPKGVYYIEIKINSGKIYNKKFIKY